MIFGIMFMVNLRFKAICEAFEDLFAENVVRTHSAGKNQREGLWMGL